MDCKKRGLYLALFIILLVLSLSCAPREKALAGKAVFPASFCELSFFTPPNSLKDIHFVDLLKGFAVGSSGTLLRTTDGEKWSSLDLGTTSGINAVATSLENPQHHFAAGISTFMSTDDGVTWSNGGQHQDVKFINGLAAVLPPQNLGLTETFIAVGESQSSPGTGAFTVMSIGGGKAYLGGSLQILRDVSAVGENAWAVGDWGVIYKSVDRGKSWAAQSSGTSQRLRTVSFVDASLGWVGGDNVFLSTSDGGANWNIVSQGPIYKDVHALDANTLARVGSSGLEVSSNGGSSWDLLSSDPGFSAVQILSDGSVWVAGRDSIKHFGSCAGTSSGTSAVSVCGDGVCAFDEDVTSCVADCAAAGAPSDGGGAGGTEAPVDLCASVDCSLLTDQCNIGVCNAADGSCSAQAVTDGTLCDDGDIATTNDICTTGTCVGTSSGTSAVSVCGDGVCALDEDVISCVADCAAAGAPSDGGGAGADATGTSDLCVSVDCSSLTDQCNRGICNPTDGSCSALSVTEGTTCNDGDALTGGEFCSNGVCLDGVILLALGEACGETSRCAAANDLSVSCGAGVCGGLSALCQEDLQCLSGSCSSVGSCVTALDLFRERADVLLQRLEAGGSIAEKVQWISQLAKEVNDYLRRVGEDV